MLENYLEIYVKGEREMDRHFIATNSFTHQIDFFVHAITIPSF